MVYPRFPHYCVKAVLFVILWFQVWFQTLVYGYLGFLIYREGLLICLGPLRGEWPAYRRQSLMLIRYDPGVLYNATYSPYIQMVKGY